MRGRKRLDPVPGLNTPHLGGGRYAAYYSIFAPAPVHETPRRRGMQAGLIWIRAFATKATNECSLRDGRMGWSMMQQNRYDLAILDLNLPHLNGFELSRLIRTDYPQLLVLLLTALDRLDYKITGFEAGADNYLAEPFDFNELMLRARVLTRPCPRSSPPGTRPGPARPRASRSARRPGWCRFRPRT